MKNIDEMGEFSKIMKGVWMKIGGVSKIMKCD